MPNATIKSAPISILLTLALWLSACVDPQTQKANELSAAARLSEQGMYDQAIDVLNELSVTYPDDLEVLLAMAAIYEAQGDQTATAFILQTAQPKDPNNLDLLLRTYRAQVDADQDATNYLETIATRSPEQMTPQMWETLGAARAEAQQLEAALEAYMKAVANEDHIPSPTTSAQIGQLFLDLGNDAQAERWFTIAAESDDPAALQGRFGLLEINLRQKNWPAAETQVQQLETQFPGAINASQWSDVPAELARWRAAQDAMRAQIAQEKIDAEARQKAEAEAQAAAEAAERIQKQETTQAEVSQSVVIDATTPADSAASVTDPADTTSDTSTATIPPNDKTGVVEELAALEAMAETTAVEPETSPETEVESPAIVSFNPDISILPADPDIANNVRIDTTPNSETDIDTAAAQTSATQAPAAAPAPAPLPEISDSLSLEELLSTAAAAEQQRDYKLAVHYYWKAISKDNRRTATWDLLSQAYFIDGQLINAENAALEALRLEPGNVNYMLDYLRIIQRTKTPEDFLAILETAYDRFPRSPEIALSLARAYERIEQDKLAARSFYKRFIELAPNHILRSEAEAAITRLR